MIQGKDQFLEIMRITLAGATCGLTNAEMQDSLELAMERISGLVKDFLSARITMPHFFKAIDKVVYHYVNSLYWKDKRKEVEGILNEWLVSSANFMEAFGDLTKGTGTIQLPVEEIRAFILPCADEETTSNVLEGICNTLHEYIGKTVGMEEVFWGIRKLLVHNIKGSDSHILQLADKISSVVHGWMRECIKEKGYIP